MCTPTKITWRITWRIKIKELKGEIDNCTTVTEDCYTTLLVIERNAEHPFISRAYSKFTKRDQKGKLSKIKLQAQIVTLVNSTKHSRKSSMQTFAEKNVKGGWNINLMPKPVSYNKNIKISKYYIWGEWYNE